MRSKTAWRVGQTSKQRQFEAVVHLARTAHPRVQGFPQEREPEPEYQSEDPGEDAVPQRPRLDLRGGAGGSDEQCIGALEDFEGAQLLCFVGKARVCRGALQMEPAKLCELFVEILTRLCERRCIELAPIPRVSQCVVLGQGLGGRRPSILNGKGEDVGVRCGGDR